jgi:type II secretory pathway pseudopilin PulG
VTRKDDLPDDPAGYLVFPRRMALLAVVGVIAAIAAPAASMWVSDQHQERRLIEVERRMQRAEDKAEKDRGDIADMKADIRVIRQILEAPARRP